MLKIGLLHFVDPYFHAFYNHYSLQILYTTNFLIENVFSYLFHVCDNAYVSETVNETRDMPTKLKYTFSACSVCVVCVITSGIGHQCVMTSGIGHQYVMNDSHLT